MLFSKGKRRKGKAKLQKVVRKKKVKERVKKPKAPKKTPKTAKKRRATPKRREIYVGKVTHYFPKVKAGAIMIKNGTIALGDVLHVKGHTTDFKQTVKSLQINRVPIKKASKGDEIGVLVKSRVRINDKVYKRKS